MAIPFNSGFTSTIDAVRRARLPLLLVPLLAAAACSAPESGSSQPEPASLEHTRGERFGLSFEERMAIRAELSRVRSEAKAKADEEYDKFSSREEAMKHGEYTEELVREKRAALREEHGLTDAQLDAIVDEYLRSQGVPVR